MHLAVTWDRHGFASMLVTFEKSHHYVEVIPISAVAVAVLAASSFFRAVADFVVL